MEETGAVTVSGKVVVTVMGGVILSTILWLGTLSAWVIEIRSNRFTQADWNRERVEILNQIPPPVVTLRLNNLERDVDGLQELHPNR